MNIYSRLNRCHFLSSRVVSARRIVTTADCGDNLVRITMAAEPVNSLNLQLMRKLKMAITAANASSCDGIVLASSCRVFCAGLDLKELHGASSENLAEFWTTFQELCQVLYSSNKFVVAEIGGHAPAAGTIISLCCDMRIAVPGARVGLNEAALGLVCPTWACEMMADNIGKRQAYSALSQGLLLSTEEGLSMGLVDKLAEDKDQLMQKVHAECLQWTSKPGRSLLKAAIRGPIVNRWKQEQADDLQTFLRVLTMPETQQRIGDYLQSLTRAKK